MAASRSKAESSKPSFRYFQMPSIRFLPWRCIGRDFRVGMGKALHPKSAFWEEIEEALQNVSVLLKKCMLSNVFLRWCGCRVEDFTHKQGRWKICFGSNEFK
ncbi:hypothetical protein TNIN_122451 [Trichonephila inaurata madagascariensis]|uniref:Uncharacterized protein n=1 Tax=Trichonephila inaurata madagascariensis TaxID=2747483 RepID=A0A8X7C7F2_9ARAC|nr:hypothetical protein TNIN_122451 [Trichonephila inaurata madagascariensis]